MGGSDGSGGSGLVVHDLSVGYGPVRALRQVSLEVPEGAVVTVLGGNGAGKSTLLRAVCRTLSFHGGAVTGGTVSLNGRRLDGLSPDRVVAAGVSQIPEGRRVFARMTVADNLRAGALGATGAGPAGPPPCAASTSCSPFSPTAPSSEPACCRAENSRCSRSAAA